MGDHGAGHHGLACAGRSDEDAAVVADEIVDRCRLLGPELADEAEVDLLGVGAIIGEVEPASETDEKIGDALGETAGKVEPFEVLAVAGDEPWRVPRREPHPLLLVELGVGDRPEVLQCRDHRGRHAGPLDREHGPESGPDHRRRSWPAATGQLREAAAQVRHRPGGAIARAPPPHPATDERPTRGTPTGPATVPTSSDRGTTCCRARRTRPGAAGRSGSRTRPWAGSPGTGRTGRSWLRSSSALVDIACRSSAAPSDRASAAATGPSKKTHTWPPLPERERSSAAGTPLAWQASRYASASSTHVPLSKSHASRVQVSPRSSG